MIEALNKQEIDEIIFFLNDAEGWHLYQKIKNSWKEIERDEESLTIFYRLKFLVIPHLSINEICELLNKYLFIAFANDDFDLIERITKKLLFMDLSDRDKCKNELKKSLENNQERIMEAIIIEGGNKLNTIADWIKDYLRNQNILQDQVLSKTTYFFQKNYITKLPEENKKVLGKIFSLYDFLNNSSFTHEGFEDDILLKTIDGKFITTSKGKVVVLYDPNKKETITIPTVKARTVSGPPKTIEEKKIEEISQMGERYAKTSLEKMAVQEEIADKKKVDDLKIYAQRFREGSLERKAIEDEIRKLEK